VRVRKTYYHMLNLKSLQDIDFDRYCSFLVAISNDYGLLDQALSTNIDLIIELMNSRGIVNGETILSLLTAQWRSLSR
jgi:hypothetical protein